MSNNQETEIIDKANELFQRFGYRKTTLTDIARSIGKVKTAVYYYFTNKEEIFGKVVRMEAETFIDRLLKAVGEHTDPVERLEAYVEARLHLMQKVAERYTYLKLEFFELLPVIESNRANALEREIEFVTALLEDVNAQGKNATHRPAIAAGMLVNTLKGFEIQLYVTEKIPFDGLDLEAFRSYILYGIVQPVNQPAPLADTNA